MKFTTYDEKLNRLTRGVDQLHRAAICGIMRIVALAGSTITNIDLKTSLWTYAEVTSTLVGVGIPSSIPAFRKLWQSCGPYRKKSRTDDTQSSGMILALKTIGGSEMLGPQAPGNPARKGPGTGDRVVAEVLDLDATLLGDSEISGGKYLC